MDQCQFKSHKVLYDGNYGLVKRDSQREVNYGLHYHDFYELQIYTSNAGILLYDGEEYGVVRGDIALINIFAPHSLIINPKTYRDRYCVDLSPVLIYSSCSEKANLLNMFSRKNPVVHLEEKEFNHIIGILDSFDGIKLAHGQEIMERAVIFQLLANLYNCTYEKSFDNKEDNQSIPMVIRLVKYIDDNLANDLSLDRLAVEANYSKFYVCRVFKKCTGTTLNKYIISKRIEKAKILLSENTSISDVSKMTGFNNYSYFYKAFKTVFNVSPADYRATFYKS